MRHPRTYGFCLALTLLATCLATGGLGAQTRAEQEKQREQWQRVSDIIRAMDVRLGATVADIGAGDGFFTSRLASAVGPSGQVFAVDVNDAQLDRLRRRLTEQSISNVMVIKGTATDPRLPTGTLDAALIINAYHEMPEHQAMLEAIRTALKPTGRLVIVEPISASRRTATRRDQTRDHEIAPEFVMQDVRAANLRIVGLEDPFTTRGRSVEWMITLTPSSATTIVAASPASSTPEAGSRDWRDPGLRISVDEFVKITSSGSATIIDVRDEGMFAKGHIPNAILIPLDDIESSADRLRGLKQPFLTYCS
jgi:predicted methyltransferase